MDVDTLPGSLWVHPGELLQVASGGAYSATPHRVVNPSFDHTRVSLPLFLNPPLSSWVKALAHVTEAPPTVESGETSHVHRVLPLGVSIEPFHFGEAEWRRKGLNGWCHACAPPRPE
jgi:isopenicillin N synthase-like dioxygenase